MTWDTVNVANHLAGIMLPNVIPEVHLIVNPFGGFTNRATPEGVVPNVL